MTETVAVILVDHGSRRAESNDMLEVVATLYAACSGRPIVEHAHMELASPSIADAFARCVERGADVVVIHPYFLLPGRHWSEDIPRIAEQAAAAFPGIRWLVTAPLGVHPGIADAVEARVEHCLACASGEGDPCEICGDGEACRFRGP